MATGFTFPIEKEMACAKSSLPISSIHAHTVCKKINGKEFLRARKFLDDLKNEKDSINGKYYTKTVTELRNFLHTLESNAVAQNFDIEAMKIFISVSKGPRMYRSKRKRNFGLAMKISNVQAVLKPFEKKEKKKVEKKIKKEEPKVEKKEEAKEVPKEKPAEIKEEPKENVKEEKVEEESAEPKEEKGE